MVDMIAGGLCEMLQVGVRVLEEAGPWQLWLEGRLGRSYLSDMGLDTLQLLQGDRWAGGD